MRDYTREIDFYCRRLFPITRSITGDGNRESLKILQEIVPIDILEYPSGLQIYDWTIPDEWNIRDAWVKNSRGTTLIDFQKNNLHLVSYSTPLHKTVIYEELLGHLHYLEEMPEAIPYRTSYYEKNWGFCLSYRDFLKYFEKGESYEVFIDSDLGPGSLTIGELLIPGLSPKEYLISTYICHPSMANDNVSGMVLTAFLARELLSRSPLNYSYRVLFVPETIGSIAYCAMNTEAMRTVRAGLVISTVGGPGGFGYKQSFDPGHYINHLIEQAFFERGIGFVTYPFDIHGSDERQYSSQGFRINAATITKDKYYEYPYYHTSLDDLDFLRPENINEALTVYRRLCNKLERNLTYKNLRPDCEVMLSRHGLYPKTGGGILPAKNSPSEVDAMLWLLFYCDGKMSLFEISQQTGISLETLYETAIRLEEKSILQRI